MLIKRIAMRYGITRLLFSIFIQLFWYKFSRSDSPLLAYRRKGRRKVSLTQIYQNSFYGIQYEIRNYCGVKSLPKAVYIEHGFYLYDTEDKFNWGARLFVTMSKRQLERGEYRSEHRLIAPYVLFARPFPITELEKSLLQGGITLVVPYHDLPGVELAFDVTAFLDAASSVGSDHGGGRLVVCLAAHDYADVTRRESWNCSDAIVTTCGSRLELSHLSRMKTLLTSANVVVTNGFGTHCVYAKALEIELKVLLAFVPEVTLTKRLEKARPIPFGAGLEYLSSDDFVLNDDGRGDFIPGSERKVFTRSWVTEAHTPEMLRGILGA